MRSKQVVRGWCVHQSAFRKRPACRSKAGIETIIWMWRRVTEDGQQSELGLWDWGYIMDKTAGCPPGTRTLLQESWDNDVVSWDRCAGGEFGIYFEGRVHRTLWTIGHGRWRHKQRPRVRATKERLVLSTEKLEQSRQFIYLSAEKSYSSAFSILAFLQ